MPDELGHWPVQRDRDLLVGLVHHCPPARARGGYGGGNDDAFVATVSLPRVALGAASVMAHAASTTVTLSDSTVRADQ
jgi:hypothetical protein